MKRKRDLAKDIPHLLKKPRISFTRASGSAADRAGLFLASIRGGDPPVAGSADISLGEGDGQGGGRDFPQPLLPPVNAAECDPHIVSLPDLSLSTSPHPGDAGGETSEGSLSGSAVPAVPVPVPIPAVELEAGLPVVEMNLLLGIVQAQEGTEGSEAAEGLIRELGEDEEMDDDVDDATTGPPETVDAGKSRKTKRKKPKKDSISSGTTTTASDSLLRSLGGSEGLPGGRLRLSAEPTPAEKKKATRELLEVALMLQGLSGLKESKKDAHSA